MSHASTARRQYPFDHLTAQFEDLCDRSGTDGTLTRWRGSAPDLPTYSGLAELAADVASRLRRGCADEIFSPLLRLASRDGDDDAALTVAHLVGGFARVEALALRDLSRDADAVIVSCLWVRIRTFRYETRTRGLARGLALDARRDALQDLTARRDRTDRRTVCVDPGILSAMLEDQQPALDGVPRLADLLEWAQRSGVVTRDDAMLLTELVAVGENTTSRCTKGTCSVEAARLVGERLQVGLRTVQRHRDQALDALRQAGPAYLATLGTIDADPLATAGWGRRRDRCRHGAPRSA